MLDFLCTNHLKYPKSISPLLQDNAENAPETADDEFTQYQPQKKWDGVAMRFQAAVSKDDPLRARADDKAEPDVVDAKVS